MRRGVTGPIRVAAGKFSIAANRWHVPITAEWEVTRHMRLGVGPEISIVTGNLWSAEIPPSRQSEVA
jgi:hypothetical protein